MRDEFVGMLLIEEVVLQDTLRIARVLRRDDHVRATVDRGCDDVPGAGIKR